jgi:hypothetical protein
MLVAVCPANGSALDCAFNARAVDPASKSQYGVSLRVEEDVLLDGAITGDIRWRLLCDRAIAGSEPQESEGKKK